MRLFSALKPAVALANQMSYPVKFGVVFALFLGILLIPLMGFYGYVNDSVNFSAKEKVGVDYLVPLKRLMVQIVRHERLQEDAQANRPGAKAALGALQTQIQDTLAQGDALQGDLGQTLDARKDWEALKTQWQAIDQATGSTHARHDAVMDGAQALMSKVGTNSNLILDPDVDSYFTMDSLVYRLMPLAQNLDQLRALSVGIAARKRMTLAEQVTLTAMVTRAQATLDLIKGNLDTAVPATKDGRYKDQLQGPFTAYHQATQAFLDRVNSQLIMRFTQQDAIGVTPAQLNALADQALTNASALYDASSDAMNRLLLARIEKIKTPMVWTLLATGAALALIAYFFAGFYGSVVSTVASLERASQALSEGNLCHEAQSDSRDELSRVVRAFNQMACSFRDAMSDIKASADRVSHASEELRRASGDINDDTDQILQLVGDTQKATQDVDASLQTVSSAIEHSDASMHQACVAGEHVEASIHDVDQAAEDVSRRMISVAASSDQMSSTVHVLAAAIEEMSASLNEVSRSANQTTQVANEAERTALATGHTMRALDESTHEITAVLNMITDIARQTNLLALNATIEAANAGEAGKGFAVVAKEVKELATRSAQASEDISRRIEAMQHNTGAAITAMGSISEIVQQINQNIGTIASAVEEQTAAVGEISKSVQGASQAANDVSTHVQETAEVAERVSGQVQAANQQMRLITSSMGALSQDTKSISGSASQVADSTSRMALQVERVSDSTRQTKGRAQRLSQTSEELATLSASLERIVSRFKIGA